MDGRNRLRKESSYFRRKSVKRNRAEVVRVFQLSAESRKAECFFHAPSREAAISSLHESQMYWSPSRFSSLDQAQVSHIQCSSDSSRSPFWNRERPFLPCDSQAYVVSPFCLRACSVYRRILKSGQEALFAPRCHWIHPVALTVF